VAGRLDEVGERLDRDLRPADPEGLGQLDAANLRVAALLMPVAAAAVLAGVRLVRILPEKLFFRLVVWALLAISLKLIADGWRAL